MPGVVVYLTLHSCMGASLLISSLLVNCNLSSLAKSPNHCCKLSLKSPEGSGQYDIYIYIYIYTAGERALKLLNDLRVAGALLYQLSYEVLVCDLVRLR